ncbi:hypothetical protein AVEN_92596-1 [Araneus ventricosus]|uniref:Uncharacterized protein n=1 Tax=Araneus ventricosus TaxID=182803 RepID=A0A4Y2AIG6_ARAVE|nr:hypothetical protein AVEN_92596-1 [Araneus ventricosus]
MQSPSIGVLFRQFLLTMPWHSKKKLLEDFQAFIFWCHESSIRAQFRFLPCCGSPHAVNHPVKRIIIELNPLVWQISPHAAEARKQSTNRWILIIGLEMAHKQDILLFASFRIHLNRDGQMDRFHPKFY